MRIFPPLLWSMGNPLLLSRSFLCRAALRRSPRTVDGKRYHAMILLPFHLCYDFGNATGAGSRPKVGVPLPGGVFGDVNGGMSDLWDSATVCGKTYRLQRNSRDDPRCRLFLSVLPGGFLGLGRLRRRRDGLNFPKSSPDGYLTETLV